MKLLKRASLKNLLKVLFHKLKVFLNLLLLAVKIVWEIRQWICSVSITTKRRKCSWGWLEIRKKRRISWAKKRWYQSSNEVFVYKKILTSKLSKFSSFTKISYFPIRNVYGIISLIFKIKGWYVLKKKSIWLKYPKKDSVLLISFGLISK